MGTLFACIHSRTFLTCCVLNSPTVRQDGRSAMMKLVLLLSLALVATTVNARFLSQQEKRDIKGMLAKLETVVEKKRELADLWNRAAGEEEEEEEKRELAAKLLKKAFSQTTDPDDERTLLQQADSSEEEEEEKRELADLWNNAAGEEEEEEEKRTLK